MSELNLHFHHKCATRWAIEYFRDVSNQNGRTFFYIDPAEQRADPTFGVVLYANSTYAYAKREGLRGVHFIRNPLNLVLSAYFSHLRTHAVDGWPQLQVQRGILQRVGFAEGLLLTVAFLERADINGATPGPLHALRTWDFSDAAFETVRVEDLTRRTSEVVGRLLPGWALPDENKYRFENFSGGRQPGVEDVGSHYRRADPDEWRQRLPDSIVVYVRETYRDLLMRFYPEAMA